MSNSYPAIHLPDNEPHLAYRPGSPERVAVEAKLQEMIKEPVEIPLVIGGEEVRTGKVVEYRAPHDHDLVLARVHQAGPEEVQAAIDAALAAKQEWAELPWYQRLAVFRRAADLLAGPYRATNNAATMLGQSKTIHQAEIEAVAELCDFWRFNAYFASELYQDQPPHSPPGIWNRMEWRPLEGFVFAITPFNFTAIGGNLPSAPAMVGNVAVWKPADTAVLSGWTTYQIMREAGLPPGVINFIQGDPAKIADQCFAHPDFAGLHFTGSAQVFEGIFKKVGENMSRYKSFPRVVGETGGKDFVVAHPSANVSRLVPALIRGAFEYQGQKCSAASRAYIPTSLWDEVRGRLQEEVATIRMGSPLDFTNFMCAVIKKDAYERITGYIERAKKSPDAEVIIGGEYGDTKGWFIQPTVILAKKPDYESMVNELFGPVLTVYVYPDEQYEETLRLCDQTSPYALTGAIFADDRVAVERAEKVLQQAAGNFYINDKPTGSIVGQQPFGGARKSGTNDKAGSWTNMVRWLSPRAIKETFDAPTDWRYPYMATE